MPMFGYGRRIIAGQLSMEGAGFIGDSEQTLSMRYASIGSNVYMPDTTFDYVDLKLAKVGGWFSIVCSTFNGYFDMHSASVGGSIIMPKTTFYKPIRMKYLNVGANLDARGAELTELDLTGAQVERGLRLGPPGNEDVDELRQCKNKSGKIPNLILRTNLILRNTSIGSLVDTKGTWPENLDRDLKGFTYHQLGASGEDAPIKRKSSWYIDWLKKNEPYSPQPYLQLAGVLRAEGLNEMADDVLLERRERERERAYSKGEYFKWLGQSTLRYVYGYGYGRHGFLALFYTMGFFIVFGTLMLWRERRKYSVISSIPDSACYSLDMLLPIIHLREQNYSDVNLTSGVRFYFYFHKVVGYLLIFFLLALLTGYTS